MSTQRRARATVLPTRFNKTSRLLERQIQNIEVELENNVEKLKKKPSEFFKKILGFEPYKYQKELIELFEKNQF